MHIMEEEPDLFFCQEDVKNQDLKALALSCSCYVCGFDGNHFQTNSLIKRGSFDRHHHNEVFTDAEGFVYPVAHLGNAHSCVISNIARLGNCACAVLLEAPCDVSTHSKNVTRIGLSPVGGEAGGCFLVLCSATLPEGTCPGSIFFVHQGNRNEDLFAKPLLSDDANLWDFKLAEDNADDIEVKGPANSHYSIHSVFSEELLKYHKNGVLGKVKHTQAFDGTVPTNLLNNCLDHGGRMILLMCSCSSGVYFSLKLKEKEIV